MTRLEAIGVRCEAATNGHPSNEAPDDAGEHRWVYDEAQKSIYALGNSEDIVVGENGTPYGVRYSADGRFIAHARGDVPWMRARLQEVADLLRQCSSVRLADEIRAALAALDEENPLLEGL